MFNQKPSRHALATTLLLFLGIIPELVFSATNSYERCLLDTIANPENATLTAAGIQQVCATSHDHTHIRTHISQQRATNNLAPPRSIAEGAFLNYFEPYKDNYISVGAMETRSGADAFSGNTVDIKFQLGMKFGLFQDIPQLRGLAPLYFGYSQKSWWDVAESSAPFREHNYNPEIFWDFQKSGSQHGLLGHSLGKYIDQLGFEHQSNGLDGLNSRSWDRVYAQKSISLLDDRLDLKFKVWNVVNLGEENSDITDFYGNVEVAADWQLNDTFGINLTAIKGHETGKYSYKLDLLTTWDWMNGKLFLTYYDGFGEALISYNEKTRSLRGGVYFAL